MVDDLIRLFESTETEFISNGFGLLSDAISCLVVEERNGEFELTMEYPIGGTHHDKLLMRNIIFVKPNPFDDPQPFRIYEIEKPINFVMTIHAHHISYDLSGYPVSSFSASGINNAISGLSKNCPLDCPFIFSTDIVSSKEFLVDTPTSIRSTLGGSEGSFIDLYGGEYLFDKFNVKLLKNRGRDNGVIIEYGKNLTDFAQDENIDNVYTGVFPYVMVEETTNNVTEKRMITVPEKIVRPEGKYSYEKILTLDMSSEFDGEPSPDQLREATKKYISENNIGVPEVSLSLSFIQLSNDKQYADLKALETIHLCDYVTIKFPLINVTVTSKCIKTEYDVLSGSYTSIELGDAKSDLAETISVQAKEIKNIPTMDSVESAVTKATKTITGGLGGYVVLNSSTGTDAPDEILVMDRPSIQQSNKIWRWNKNGLGFSKNGYNGPYELAMTINGEIVADFITAGTLSGKILQLGTVDSAKLSDDIRNFVDVGSLWLSFDPSSDGLIIGRNNSPYKIRITNDSINFLNGDTPVAIMTGDKIEITHGYFTTDLIIGRKGSTSSFGFVPRSNGTLDFKYTGS
ncbi:MAG: phage tail protein [Prevotellaceae bacterium]|nr:phage tail protein [Candidatus Colivivens equi]